MAGNDHQARSAPALAGDDPQDIGAGSTPSLILDHLRDGIALQDLSGRIEWINPACERMFGWPLEEVRGRKPQEFALPPAMRPAPESITTFRYDPSGGIFRRLHVVRNIRRDGSEFWNQLSHAMIDMGPREGDKRVVVTCRDITDQVRTEAALHRAKNDLEHAAHHDDLTGLANRTLLSAFLDEGQVRARLGDGHIGVLQLDIDKFKEINDTLGHAAGDATLRHVAAALAANCGRDDLACRTGGDEFLLVCLGVASQEALLARAELLRRAVAAPLDWHGQEIAVRISVGASRPDGATGTGEALIRQADQALYAAKEGGRGRVMVYTGHLGRRCSERQQMARDLRAALSQGQFRVHLQPQITPEDRQIAGCEALLRWQHPERGLLAPAAFMEVAESAALLSEIDQASTLLALDALKRLRDAGFDGLRLSLNVSSAILSAADYPALLHWALQARNLPPESVCVEILETAILDGGPAGIRTAVWRLRRMGVRVALDDFGTGYAGLAHLTAFEIDTIKLDRTLTGRLGHDSRSRAITRAVIRLCNSLGMTTVAEGVETQVELDFLRRARCPLAQGYTLARPMEVEEMIGWLDDAPAACMPGPGRHIPDARNRRP